ncbi:MAG: RDD family protein [Acidobacteria bacterium]|nr:RDD family protein [Acidobacteriota bacterium]
MKCPKCGYLGFEHVERCRNCGYDFLLSQSAGLPELPLREDVREPGPLADLELVGRTARAGADEVARGTAGDFDGALAPAPPVAADFRATRLPAASPLAASAAGRSAAGAPSALDALNAPRADGGPGAPGAASSRLPLFPAGDDDDAPLISRPSPPRQPLAVRRPTPESARLRAEAVRSVPLALPLAPEPAAHSGAAGERPRAGGATPPQDVDTASVGARVAAATIDLAILAAIDAAVVYFTMQICGLTTADLAIVPKVPLAAFLFAQNGGYLVAFTAGGQTLGKMAAGIRIVSAEGESGLDVTQALIRTLCWIALAVPGGLGFASAVFSRDRRGLHDRCAGTRVVRASA